MKKSLLIASLFFSVGSIAAQAAVVNYLSFSPYQLDVEVSDVVIPEPSSAGLMALGLLGLALRRRR